VTAHCLGVAELKLIKKLSLPLLAVLIGIFGLTGCSPSTPTMEKNDADNLTSEVTSCRSNHATIPCLSAAEQGNPYAQYVIALKYFEGRGGTPLDTIEAIKWHHKAAAQGF